MESVLNIKDRWAGFTRSNRIAFVLAQTAIFASCVGLLVMFSPTVKDWQDAVVGVGLVLVCLEGVVVLVVMSIASRRRTQRNRATATKPVTKTFRERVAGWGYTLVFWFGIALLYAAGGYAAEWLFPASELATRWRYSLDDDLKNAEYVMPTRPHDCEFMTAPLGEKHCHYNKEVATVRVRKAQSGGRVISYDEGKTWELAVAVTRSTVLVSWRKIED